jgi:hypothetical protein
LKTWQRTGNEEQRMKEDDFDENGWNFVLSGWLKIGDGRLVVVRWRLPGRGKMFCT